MTILALTKAHQSQVKQLFNDVDFFVQNRFLVISSFSLVFSLKTMN